MAWIPGMLAIILFSAFFFKCDISFVYQKVFISFYCCSPNFYLKQGWDKTCTNIKEHFDNILIVHLGKVIRASLACCTICADMRSAPLFFSSMNLRTYPSNFENFLQGLVHRKIYIQCS